MLTYSNIQRFEGMPFEDYLTLSSIEQDKFYSHSFLKSEESGTSPLFIPSNKVKLGKMVDSILMDKPEEVDVTLPEFQTGKKIASAIKAKFGDMIKNFVPQVSYAGQLSYKGLVMNVCGRLDWELPKLAVIDLKVTDAKTDKEFAKIIEFMKYGNQLFNYRGLAGVRQSFLLPYSTTAKTCLSVVKMEYSPTAEEFWKSCVIKFGK